MQEPQQGEEEDTLNVRQQSHHQASSSTPAVAAADNAGSKQTSFWGRAAVGAGALVLVGVFVLATVGVDLGLGGRRSKSSPSQVELLSKANCCACAGGAAEHLRYTHATCLFDLLHGLVCLACCFLLIAQPDTLCCPHEQQVASLTAEQQKQLGEQAAQLEAQAKGETGSTDALAGAAGSYAALGNLDKSTALLEQLTTKSPSDASAWQALVSTLACNGHEYACGQVANAAVNVDARCIVCRRGLAASTSAPGG